MIDISAEKQMKMQKRKLVLTDLPALLLTWYDKNARVLPWRDNPLPYYVWVSEIMLQQTRVEAVKPYFERFLKAFPTIHSLAYADEDALLKVWEGLGYYNRVRNMQKAASIIVEKYNGEIPPSYEAVLSLPGIGEYTAGAIASIAYQIRVPAVDGNVLRVLARVLASFENISVTTVKKSFKDEIHKILPTERVGDFNQAFMEIGATICLPNGMPKCGACPLAGICAAKANSLQANLPIKTAKKERVIEKRTVFVIVFKNKVALRQRKETGILARMWEFPNELDDDVNAALIGWGVDAISIKELGCAKHIFTHKEWHMQGYLVHAASSNLLLGWVWASPIELKERFALPSAFRAYLKYFFNLIDEQSRSMEVKIWN